MEARRALLAALLLLSAGLLAAATPAKPRTRELYPDIGRFFQGEDTRGSADTARFLPVPGDCDGIFNFCVLSREFKAAKRQFERKRRRGEKQGAPAARRAREGDGGGARRD